MNWNHQQSLYYTNLNVGLMVKSESNVQWLKILMWVQKFKNASCMWKNYTWKEC